MCIFHFVYVCACIRQVPLKYISSALKSVGKVKKKIKQVIKVVAYSFFLRTVIFCTRRFTRQLQYTFLLVYSPESMGLLDPSTSDGRVIFFLPWQKTTLAGRF